MKKLYLLGLILTLVGCDNNNEQRNNIAPSKGTSENIITNSNNIVNYSSYTSEPLKSQNPLSSYLFNIKNNSSIGNTNIDSNVLYAWEQGITGKNIHIAIVDTGVDTNHEDLKEHIIKSYSYSSDHSMLSEDEVNLKTLSHGTAVAGIISASNNDIGTVGVAYDSLLYPIRIMGPFTITTFDISDINGNEQDLLGVNNIVDIYNKSYGFLDPYRHGNIDPLILESLQYSTSHLRNGKGAIHVASIGNDYNKLQYGGASKCRYSFDFTSNNKPCTDTTHSSSLNNPYQINVGAINTSGKHSLYSNYGSSLWVSAISSGYGYYNGNPKYYGVVSTSQMGCGDFHKTNTIVNLTEQLCNYTSSFGGTSAASPVVSGVIALLLEKYPSLSWIDVKDILSRSSVIVDPNNSIKYESSPYYGDIIWDYGWQTNSAGFKYSNLYGFGLVDVKNALKIASERLKEGTLGNYLQPFLYSSAEKTTVYTDGNESSVDIDIARGDINYGLSVSFTLSSKIKEGYYDRNLQVLLESPDGQRSIIKTYGSDFGKTTNLIYTGSKVFSYNILVNNFYGVNSYGKWKIIFKDFSQEDTYFKENVELNSVSDPIFDVSNVSMTVYTVPK